jgi:hypothetical protein
MSRRWRPHPITVLTIGVALAFALADARARRRARPRGETGLTRDQIIAARARASTADFMRHGPRLWVDRQCYVVGRSSDGSRVLLAGVGAMGMGRMWAPTGSHASDPTFSGAPVDDDALDDFGENGRGVRQWTPAAAGREPR